MHFLFWFQPWTQKKLDEYPHYGIATNQSMDVRNYA